MVLELVFSVTGANLPTDHSYPLYGALSGIVPQFHTGQFALRFGPITGIGIAEGRMQLTEHSCLRVRLPDDSIRVALPLAGKKLTVGDSAIRLGVPSVRTLTPAPALIARLVTFKNADTPEEFLTTARAKLAEAGIAGEPQLPIHLEGDRAGEPKRRVIRIKGVTIYGYALIVAELTAPDSLKLQESGLGGRTQMGCGFFLAVKGVGK